MNRLKPASILVLLVSLRAVSAFAAWEADTLVSDVAITNPAVAVDSSGAIHAVYRDGGAGLIHYGTWTNGAWTDEIISDTGATGAPTSLAVTAGGDPLVGYLQNSAFRIATRPAGEWLIEIPDTTGWVEELIRVGVGPDDAPHILFHRQPGYGLHYGTAAAPPAFPREWSIEFIQASHPSASLAIDPEGEPHVASTYEQGDSGYLRYVERIAGAWDMDTVYSAYYEGITNVHLALAPDGAPHILFSSVYAEPVRDHHYLGYAVRTDTSWVVEYVRSSTVTAYTSLGLAIDRSGVLLALYSTYDMTTGGSLRLARNEGGGWEDETIASGVRYPCLAVGADGVPCVLAVSENGRSLILLRESIPVGLPSEAAPVDVRFAAVARPNPSTGSVTIRFASPFSGPATIGIFDIRGRVVADLETSGATGAVAWEGRDVPPGVYFVRVTAGGRVATDRVVLIR